MSNQKVIDAFFNLSFYRRKKEWKLTGDEDVTGIINEEETNYCIPYQSNHQPVKTPQIDTPWLPGYIKEGFENTATENSVATDMMIDDVYVPGWLLNESQIQLLSDRQLLSRMSLYEEQVLIMKAEYNRRLKVKEEKAEAEKMKILLSLLKAHK